jgi:hypothetical protein
MERSLAVELVDDVLLPLVAGQSTTPRTGVTEPRPSRKT